MASQSARDFAASRDSVVDRARAEADRRFKSAFDPKSAMGNPETYMSDLFTVLGMSIVKDFFEESRSVGKSHAERLL